MRLNRRHFFGLAGAGAVGLAMPSLAAPKQPDLKAMTGDVKPITKEERLERIHRAQGLMKAEGLAALVVEPGAAMVYFTGVEWWRSERPTLAIIPVEGDIGIITPFFEEPSIRETLAIPADVRVWQEDQNPFSFVEGLLADRRLTKGAIGMEETVRFFIADGIAWALPAGFEIRTGAAVARALRMRKSPAEIALMQKASDITMAAYRHTYQQIQAGMRASEIAGIMNGAMEALGATPEFSLVLLNEASAYPHGSKTPQAVTKGGIVLMDCGCTVEGYQADISRTFVFGEASKEQRKVWNEVHQGQVIALEAARLGAPAGSVDDAVRKYYEALGYGPGYRLPGLSHRTGHGIGLDGHEPVNLVHGEMTPISVGMCFSNEPGIYLPKKFGVRLEDCFHMTESGPQWFSVPPPSLDQPFG